MTGYVIPFVWGLAVLAALIGWGGVAARLFGKTDSRVDWGLAAGWGMALVLAFGGAFAFLAGHMAAAARASCIATARSR